MPRLEAFSETRFILGEGFGETCFARALIKFTARRIGPYDVSSVEDLSHRRGKDGFEDAMVAAEPLRNFHAVTDVVILTDGDEDPSASFQNIRAQIERARSRGTRNWAVPDTPGEKAVGDPSVTVWAFPEPGTPGCLESLLWRAIIAKHHPKHECIERACQCMEILDWPAQRIDKARVRSFLAMNNQPDRYDVLWRDAPNLIPLGRLEFTVFANLLRGV